jgi:hypothetical protein
VVSQLQDESYNWLGYSGSSLRDYNTYCDYPQKVRSNHLSVVSYKIVYF